VSKEPDSPTPVDAPIAGTIPAEGSVAEVEAAIDAAIAERDAEFAVVQRELSDLSATYDRLRIDLDAMAKERDRALSSAREERETRARERLELAERLEEVRERDESKRRVNAAALRERFVSERLAASAPDRQKLPEGSLPKIDGYEFLRRIGRGGMATVFLARRNEDGTEVAIKLLQDGGDASRSRSELFLREAAVMLQLDHPGLVGATDAGECAYGRYLVMEFVPGESLTVRMRNEGRLDEPDAVRIAIQVARALSYCARLGLTHRDVKPGNVLFDADGAAKLCDFGLAALSGGGDAAKPFGSPGYAAPEQLATPAEVDERADIYGLGCTLWQMVVGCRPFAGPAAEAFAEARKKDLPDPRTEGASVSAGLAQVIRRMGRADRAKRYRRWDEALLDLMLVEKGNPPLAAHLADQTAPGSAPVHASAVRATPRPVLPTPPAAPAAAPAPSPAPARVAERVPQDDAILPRAAAARPRVRTYLLLAALTACVGYALAAMTRPDPAAEMIERARSLANMGRQHEAVSALREAARLSSADVAARLRWEADVMEKKKK
jgi:serine/threonine protein kinase